jgi:hypothetical protein
MSEKRLLTFTDEKLEDYLRIWNRLIEQGHKKMLDITLTGEYGGFAFPLLRRYTLTYGEEKRELTCEQAFRVCNWLEYIARPS